MKSIVILIENTKKRPRHSFPLHLLISGANCSLFYEYILTLFPLELLAQLKCG